MVNTSQTGYQEIATDPRYAGQLVVMTYPLIGNYGRVSHDDQSERPWLRGLIVANATAAVLDDARQLATMLREAGIPAIAGVDTRALARHLRANGCLRAIVTAPGETDPEEARALARAVPRWEDQDFVAQVSPADAARRGRPVRGRPAGRDPRLRAQDEHRAQPPPPRGARADPAPHRHGRRGPGARTWTASSSRPGPAIRPGWTARWPWPAR